MAIFDKATATVRRHLPAIILIICVLQPLMDVLSFWLGKLSLSNAPTLVLRFAVLAVTVIFGFAVSERRKVYYIAAAVSLLIFAGHAYACLEAGYSNPISDFTNYVRVIQMPWTAICLISFFRCGDNVYRSMKKGLVISLFIILAVELLAQITGTEPHTYIDGYGIIGWFNTTNSQSSILSILVPLAVTWLYINRGFKSPLFWVAFIGGFAAMFFFGTRLCFFSFAATCFGIALSMILIRRSDWKRAVVFCLTGIIFVSLMPSSPMMLHRNLYTVVQSNRQELVNQTVPKEDTVIPSDDPDISEEELKEKESNLIEKLTPIYELYSPDFVKMFGARRTIEMYDYTSDVTTITQTRPKKLMYARMLMEDSPSSARFFGIELGRFTVGENIYDVENDFHGIYYLYGAVGLAAMLAFLLYFVYLIVYALIKDPKKYFTLDAAACGIAFILCLINVYFTAGVLRRPNASFYLSIVLASIYYLVRIKVYSPAPEPEKIEESEA